MVSRVLQSSGLCGFLAIAIVMEVFWPQMCVHAGEEGFMCLLWSSLPLELTSLTHFDTDTMDMHSRQQTADMGLRSPKACNKHESHIETRRE